MFLLSQISDVNPGALRDWLVILAGLLGIAVLVKQLFPKRTPPLEAEFATKKDVKETDRKIDSLRKDVDDRFEGLQIERARNLGELHEKINGVAGDVAFIRGKMEGKHHDH